MKTKTKLTLALGLAVVMVLTLIQAGTWLKPVSVAVAAYSDPVGFVKISLGQNDYTQISIPLNVSQTDGMKLNDNDDAETCVGEMLAEVLTGTQSPGTADRLLKYLGGGTYDIAWLFDSGGTYMGGAFDGKWIDQLTSALSTMELGLNMGYYLQRQSGAAPVDAVVLGDVATEDTIAVTIANNDVSLVNYPYPVTVDINDSVAFITIPDGYGTQSPGTSDRILKYAGGDTFEIAWLFDSGGTYMGGAFDGVWIDQLSSNPSTMQIAPGEGFFYDRKNQGAVNWVVTRPYSVE
jgi:hypothetical protein